MEFNRQLRFLIPPFVFFASLLLDATIDPQFHLLATLGQNGSFKDLSQLLPLVLAGGIAVVAVVFLISSLAIFVLSLIFCRAPGGYEANVSKDALPRIWNAISWNRTPMEHDMLYAVAAFDHWKLPTQLHEWCGRRWTAFMVCMNCVVALGFAHLAACAAPSYRIAQSGWWCKVDLVLAVVLLVNGFVARYPSAAHDRVRLTAFEVVGLRNKVAAAG